MNLRITPFWNCCNVFFFVSETKHNGMLGYSRVDLFRLLYNLLLVSALSPLNHLSLVVRALAVAILVFRCAPKPVLPSLNHSMFTLFVNCNSLLSILMVSGFVFDIDKILNLFLLVLIFHFLSYSLILLISLSVLLASIFFDRCVYSMICVMSSAKRTSVPPAPGGGMSKVKYKKCRR